MNQQNHKWSNDTCIKCGINRQKVLTATANTTQYNPAPFHWLYLTNGKRTYHRPNCHPEPSHITEVKRWLKFEEEQLLFLQKLALSFNTDLVLALISNTQKAINNYQQLLTKYNEQTNQHQ